MTRRLIAAGQRPVTVGMFFSLGHSTYFTLLSYHTNPKKSLLTTPYHSIVVITSIAVAATASAVSSKFSSFSRVGAIIGTSVSAGFLILLGIMNLYILYKLVQQMRMLIATRPGEEEGFKIQGAGCLFHLFKKMF